MGKLMQRKRFPSVQWAQDVADAFSHYPWAGLVKVSAVVHVVESEFWVYVIQEGEMITENEPLLPGYELTH